MKLFQIIPLGLACALAVAYPSGARAQDAATALSGECIPHLSEQGPWDCKVLAPFKPQCISGSPHGFDNVWSIVDDEQEAIVLLRSKYAEMNDLRKFSQWLMCQGFDVRFMAANTSAAASEPSMGIHVSYYLSFPPPFPVPWYRIFKPWSGNFAISLNNFGSMAAVDHSYTTE